MTRTQAIEWTKTQKRANQLADTVIDGVCRCIVERDKIQLYQGIATLSDALGVPYKVEMLDGERDFPVRISFVFDGIEYFQLERYGTNATVICHS